MDAYRAGRIALANAPGTGIADDKVVYAYVPQIIKYYLSEDPIIPNVPTYVCWDDNAARPRAGESRQAGGEAGERIGRLRHADRPAGDCRGARRVVPSRSSANPRNYIAQPTLSLSRVPVLTDDGLEGRHVDLRPFIVYGKEIYVLPGGLTRVALKKGSLVVNSSQGGGSKDTWVVS